MKRKTQKQKLLERLNQYKGRRISFRAFWREWIAEPWSRKSELCSEWYKIVNDWFYNEKWQKCSYYAIAPRIKSAKTALEKWETVEMFVY